MTKAPHSVFSISDTELLKCGLQCGEINGSNWLQILALLIMDQEIMANVLLIWWFFSFYVFGQSNHILVLDLYWDKYHSLDRYAMAEIWTTLWDSSTAEQELTLDQLRWHCKSYHYAFQTKWKTLSTSLVFQCLTFSFFSKVICSKENYFPSINLFGEEV